MTTSELKKLTCANPSGQHHIAYQKWGRKTERTPVICVHGLTRNSHDFDVLASSLSRDRLVICPDIVGRGQSDRLKDPAFYDYPQYAADMTNLISEIGGGPVDWVGTSMGGLIGMMLAAMPSTPIRRFVINDVGPYLEAAALERIGTYTGLAEEFSSLDELEDYLRKVHAPFAPMTDKNWQDMARHGAEQTDEGRYRLNYDPKIGDALRDKLTGEDVDLWPLWLAISCPVLLFRGGQSDLLSAETANKMTETGPSATLVTIDEAGHAPSLMSEDQIILLRDWLNE